MTIATAYETHRDTVFPQDAGSSYVSIINRRAAGFCKKTIEAAMFTLFTCTMLLTSVGLLISAQNKIQQSRARITVPIHTSRG